MYAFSWVLFDESLKMAKSVKWVKLHVEFLRIPSTIHSFYIVS